MSELKAFDITVAEEYYCEGIVKYRRAVYDKSKADKVIEELKDEASTAHRVCSRQIQQIASNEQEIRHQKYKRCLAMARWCEAEVHRSLTEQSALIDFPEIDRFQYLQWHFTHFSRWHKRWLELAEKFKPNKEAK